MITPIGKDRESTWQSLARGASGAGPITLFPLRDAPVRFACEVKNWDPTTRMDHRMIRRTDRYAQFALAVAREALVDAKLDIHTPSFGLDSDRVGTSVSTGIGGLETLDIAHEHRHTKGMSRMSPLWITMFMPNMASALVSMQYHVTGPSNAIATACAASGMAVADATKLIRDDTVDLMIVGGSDAPITPLAVGGFHAMRATSQRNDDPATASRPFDLGRDGFVLGEGSTMLVLEELEHARTRGARIYAEILDCGITADAHHLTEPDPTGIQPGRAMQLALDDAAIGPTEVGYLNAHGTSTTIGDRSETRVIKQIFGEHAAKLAVSSTKSMTGHMFGAAGSTEIAISALALSRGLLPPTINQIDPDPECDLDYICNSARSTAATIALSNGFGFGGHNTSTVIARWDGTDGRSDGVPRDVPPDPVTGISR